MMKRYTSPETLAANLPFCDAVQVGRVLYLSGQLGNEPGTRNLVPGGIVPETHQTMKNIQRVLSAHGLTLDALVTCTIMLADISQWSAFNEVYLTYFKGERPARSAFGANGLALGAQVEIECSAYLG